MPEIAALLRCDERTVRRMCAQGRIAARKRGTGSWLIFAAWVEEFCTIGNGT